MLFFVSHDDIVYENLFHTLLHSSDHKSIIKFIYYNYFQSFALLLLYSITKITISRRGDLIGFRGLNFLKTDESRYHFPVSRVVDIFVKPILVCSEPCPIDYLTQSRKPIRFDYFSSSNAPSQVIDESALFSLFSGELIK